MVYLNQANTCIINNQIANCKIDNKFEPAWDTFKGTVQRCMNNVCIHVCSVYIISLIFERLVKLIYSRLNVLIRIRNRLWTDSGAKPLVLERWSYIQFRRAQPIPFLARSQILRFSQKALRYVKEEYINNFNDLIFKIRTKS